MGRDKFFVLAKVVTTLANINIPDSVHSGFQLGCSFFVLCSTIFDFYVPLGEITPHFRGHGFFGMTC